MKTPVPKQTAEAEVARKFYQLYAPLIELVDSLQDLEPGGTLVDSVVINRHSDDRVHIEYVAEPIMLTIREKRKKLILRVVESTD